MTFENIQKRAVYCINNKTCFISLEKLDDDNLKYIYHSDTNLEVPVNKKYVKE